MLSLSTLLDPYSALMFALVIAIMLGFVSLRLFRGADVPPSSETNRVATIDGLRGLLAPAVFLHHVAINYRFIRDGSWVVPPSRLYTFAGDGSVGLFFMITGYLFWSRLLSGRGRMPWARLYIGRVFRLVPVFLAVIIPAIGLAMTYHDWRLNVPPRLFLHQIMRWLSSEIFEQFDLNNMDDFRHEMGMVWTLRCEWFFYLALLPLSLIARLPRLHVVIVGLALPVALYGIGRVDAVGAPDRLAFLSLFLCGMMTASLQAEGWLAKSRPAILSVLAMTGICACAIWYPVTYEAFPTVVLGIVFYLVVSGGDLFGLLIWRPTRRLGDISYGVYLGQGLILYAAFANPTIRSFAQVDNLHFWMVAMLCGVSLVAFATVLHNLVENPGISLGRKVSRQSAGPR